MKDPGRLIHEHPSTLARSLLRAAIKEEPRDSLLATTLQATIGPTALTLGHTAVQPTATSTPPTALTTAAAASVVGSKGATWLAVTVKWVGIASVGSALTVSGVKGVKARRALLASPPQLSHQLLPSRAKTDVPSSLLPAAAGSVEAEPESADVAATSSATRPSKSVASASPSAGGTLTPMLSEEARVIDQARAAVARGDGAAALVILEGHRKRFERPRLRPEALYLRMRALRLEGDTQAAVRAAEQQLKEYPDGPQSSAARAVVNAGAR